MEDINSIRRNLIMKGYLNKSDIMRFCRCGYKRASEIYDDVVALTEKDNKKVSQFGISPRRLLQVLELKEQDIFKYAKLEEELKKDV